MILDHGDDRVADRVGKRRSGFSATRDSRRNILTAAATCRSAYKDGALAVADAGAICSVVALLG
jgi:hypothetical protein